MFLVICISVYILLFPVIYYFNNKAYKLHGNSFLSFVKSFYHKIAFFVILLQNAIVLNYLIMIFEKYGVPFFNIDTKYCWLIAGGISLLPIGIISLIFRLIFSKKIKQRTTKELV